MLLWIGLLVFVTTVWTSSRSYRVRRDGSRQNLLLRSLTRGAARGAVIAIVLALLGLGYFWLVPQ
jgi:hypothetical protein